MTLKYACKQTHKVSDDFGVVSESHSIDKVFRDISDYLDTLEVETELIDLFIEGQLEV